MKLMATITAVNDDGFYQARTNFGTICRGVSLEGIDKTFKVGQQVNVYQVNGEFGAFGGNNKSLLQLPPGVVENNKELAALGFIARLAGNTKKMYDTGTVQAIDGKNVVVDGVKMPCEIDTSDLYIGATVMMHVLDKKNPKVLGWWNCVPLKPSYSVIRISRIPFSSSVDMCRMNHTDSWNIGSRVVLTRFPDREYVDWGAIEGYLNSLDSDEYFYSKIIMRRFWGWASEIHYVRWHRTNFTVEEITDLEYAGLLAAQPPHTKTADDKFWHYVVMPGSIASCYVSDTLEGPKTLVISIGYIHESQVWLPVKGHIYKPWEVQNE